MVSPVKGIALSKNTNLPLKVTFRYFVQWGKDSSFLAVSNVLGNCWAWTRVPFTFNQGVTGSRPVRPTKIRRLSPPGGVGCGECDNTAILPIQPGPWPASQMLPLTFSRQQDSFSPALPSLNFPYIYRSFFTFIFSKKVRLQGYKVTLGSEHA